MRLTFPKRLRDAIGECTLYFAPGTEGSIGVYPEAVFAALADRLSGSSPVGGDVRTFSRLFFAQAHAVEIDKQGRVRLPQELLELGGLDKEVVLLGVRDHLELWNRDAWNAYREAQQSRYDEIAERAFDESAGKPLGSPVRAAPPCEETTPQVPR